MPVRKKKQTRAADFCPLYSWGILRTSEFNKWPGSHSRGEPEGECGKAYWWVRRRPPATRISVTAAIPCLVFLALLPVKAFLLGSLALSCFDNWNKRKSCLCGYGRVAERRNSVFGLFYFFVNDLKKIFAFSPYFPQILMQISTAKNIRGDPYLLFVGGKGGMPGFTHTH